MTNFTRPTRRTVLRTSALAAAATLLPAESTSAAQSGATTYAPKTLKPPTPDVDLPIRLGIASYTFRSFPDPAKLIDFMRQLKTPLLNLKSVHLPLTTQDMDPKTTNPTLHSAGQGGRAGRSLPRRGIHADRSRQRHPR